MADPTREAFDSVYATSEERQAVLIDGRSGGLFSTPVPPPPAAKPAAPSPAEPAETGPGFWSRLGSGLSDLGGKLADVANSVEVRRIPAAPRAIIPEPPPQAPWAWIAAGLGLLALLLVAFRR